LIERCSAISRAAGESLVGTASTVRSWLLLDWPGPWGSDALRSPRLPQAVRGPLRERANETGVRVVLIRRVGRPTGEPGRVAFLIHTGPERAWAERAELNDAADLLEADLEALAAGTPPGFGAPHLQPVYVVCTHGRRDPCCAERGRPLAAALAGARPGAVWESSHIGGDRFAGNVVSFPHGLYHGWVEPPEGAEVAEAYERGEVRLDGYRGRSCYGFAVQVAEAHVRQREGIVGVDALRLTGVTRSGPHVEARFALEDGREVGVTVRVGRADPRPLTCHSEHPGRPRTFTVETP
jgi:hypothetical protein